MTEEQTTQTVGESPDWNIPKKKGINYKTLLIVLSLILIAYAFILLSFNKSTDINSDVDNIILPKSGVWTQDDYNILVEKYAQPGYGKYIAKLENFLNRSSDEEIMEMLKINGNIIRLIDNPSEDLMLFVVQRDPSSIQHISKPSEEAQIVALNNDPSVINLISHTTEKVLETMLNIENRPPIKVVIKNVEPYNTFENCLSITDKIVKQFDSDTSLTKADIVIDSNAFDQVRRCTLIYFAENTNRVIKFGSYSSSATTIYIEERLNNDSNIRTFDAKSIGYFGLMENANISKEINKYINDYLKGEVDPDTFRAVKATLQFNTDRKGYIWKFTFDFGLIPYIEINNMNLVRSSYLFNAMTGEYITEDLQLSHKSVGAGF